MGMRVLLSWSFLVSTTLLAPCAWAAADVPPAKSEAHKAEITILYDAFGKSPTMKKDWGFAALIEYGGKRILFDSGNNSDIFAQNVKAKGVDLTQLDFAIISHRHGDHMGGLNHLLSVNPGVTIYVPQENFGVFGAALPGTFYKRDESLPADMRYFDGKPPETLRFGSAWPEANAVIPRLKRSLRQPRRRSANRSILSLAASICCPRMTRRSAASPQHCEISGTFALLRPTTAPANPPLPSSGKHSATATSMLVWAARFNWDRRLP